MVIDCHYHLDERLLPIGDLIDRMDASGVDRIALMATMNGPIAPPSPFLLSFLRFFLNHRSLRGLGKAMIGRFTPEGEVKLASEVLKIYPDPDNEPVFKATADYPDKFCGWAFVNPRGEKGAVEELARWKDAPGFIGVKAHPFWHHFPPVELVPVARELVALGKPLLIHAGFGVDGDYDALLQQAPDLKLILAHAGFPQYSDTWKAIRGKENVYVDLSQTTFVNERMTRQVVECLGVERCLFGTDGPYGPHASDGTFDCGFIKERIESLFPDKGAQRRLLGENFAELAGGW